MLKGCKFRIYPTKEQEKILFIYCKYSHIARNFLVEKFKNSLPNVSSYGIVNYKEENLISDFQSEIPLPKRLYRGVLYNYANSVKRVYKRIGNKPKFHKYDPNKQSFYLSSQILKISNNFKIKLPAARGFSIKGKSQIIVDKEYITKFNISEIKEPRFKYESGKWYITGSYDVFEPIKQNSSTIIGLDWGIKNFMTSSKGKFINYPKTVLREFYRINKLKSLRDKKIKNSNNYNKLNNKIKLAYERFENLKRNFIEQTTTKLCRHNNIAIEDLTNAKIRMSNKNRRRLIQINPLSRFTNTLKWKCKKFGTDLFEVNPAYTSQTCSCCGNKINLTLKDRVFNCSCGNVMDRDINAAINIAAKSICGIL